MALSLRIAGAGSIVTALVVRGLVTRSCSAPVRRLSDAVQHVVETKDFQPVSLPGTSGEVATLASWFNRLLRMVAQMRERQTRLVLDAGHELRNPLTSLRSNVDLLAVDLVNDRLSTGQRTEIVGDVQAQLGELSGLVTDLTHLARDEDEVRPQPLDVREVVETAVDRVRRRGQDRVFDVELQPLFMIGHTESLCRAVVNLLDNAVKWTPAGGTIVVSLDGNRLRVSDEGPGIPDADQPYVFDRFFRGQTGRGTPGTGLGLSIVAKTVADHGGTVQVGRSASGGAEFVVQLPGVTSREALSPVLARCGARPDATGPDEARAAAARPRGATLAARRARAVVTTRTADAMAETVRQQASTVQDHANAAAREVAAAAARAASRVASAVRPGQEAEARRAATLVAQVTADAASATAGQTARVAAATACAAAAAATSAAEAADAAELVELDLRSTAEAMEIVSVAMDVDSDVETHQGA